MSRRGLTCLVVVALACAPGSTPDDTQGLTTTTTGTTTTGDARPCS